MNGEIPELMEVTASGRTFTVVRLAELDEADGVSVIRVPIVGGTVEEVTSLDAYRQACEVMVGSVTRRGLTPAGGVWHVGTSPVDWPLWRDGLAADVVATVEAAMTGKPDPHIIVFELYAPAVEGQ